MKANVWYLPNGSSSCNSCAPFALIQLLQKLRKPTPDIDAKLWYKAKYATSQMAQSRIHQVEVSQPLKVRKFNLWPAIDILMCFVDFAVVHLDLVHLNMKIWDCSQGNLCWDSRIHDIGRLSKLSEVYPTWALAWANAACLALLWRFRSWKWASGT